MAKVPDNYGEMGQFLVRMVNARKGFTMDWDAAKKQMLVYCPHRDRKAYPIQFPPRTGDDSRLQDFFVECKREHWRRS